MTAVAIIAFGRIGTMPGSKQTVEQRDEVLRAIVRDLKVVVDRSGVAIDRPGFATAACELLDAANLNAIDVEVVNCGGTAAEVLGGEALTRTIPPRDKGGVPLRVHFAGRHDHAMRPLGHVRAPVLIQIGESDVPEGLRDDRTLTILAAASRVRDADLFESSNTIPFDGPPEQLMDFVASHAHRARDGQGWLVAAAVHTLAVTLSSAIVRERELVRFKRLQLRGAVSPPHQSASTEAISGALALIKRRVAEAERSIGEHCRGILVPNGPVMLALEDQLQQMRELQRTSLNNVIVTTIAPGVLTACHATVQRVFKESLADVACDVSATLRAYSNEVMAGAGVALPPIQWSLGIDSLQQAASSALTVTTTYRGELRKYGLTEVSALAYRQVYLLAVLSLCGLSAASLLREHPWIGIGLTAVALLVTLSIVIPKEQADAATRELDRARDVLRSEYQRRIADVRREVSIATATGMQDFVSEVTLLVQAGVRSSTTAAPSRDRSDLAAQEKVLDIRETRLAEAQKVIIGITRAAERVREQYRRTASRMASGEA